MWGATTSAVSFQNVSTFQSTRPVWGATAEAEANRRAAAVSIHAPRVGRDRAFESLDDVDVVSIHAPRVGRDPFASVIVMDVSRFQSTRPVWGATLKRSCVMSRMCSFNPRAPCGARPLATETTVHVIGFQSTRPVWGATAHNWPASSHFDVSIHAPRVGRDSFSPPRDHPAQGFNPRAPCGARQTLGLTWEDIDLFQSTRPVWGATGEPFSSALVQSFQSTRPVWGATTEDVVGRELDMFQSTRPVWGATWPDQ